MQASGDAKIVYAEAGDGAFKSINAGTTWTPLKLPIARGRLFVFPENALHLIAYGDGSITDSFYESKDAGETWSKRLIHTELGTPKRKGNIVHSDGVFKFSIDSVNDGGAWWFLAHQGLWRSDDQGNTWIKTLEFVDAQYNYNSFPVIHTGSATFVLYRNILYRSVDRGHTWERAAIFPSNEQYGIKTFIALQNGRLVVNENHVWQQSDDNGSSWQKAPEFQALQLAADTAKARPRSSRPANCSIERPNPNATNKLIARCQTPASSETYRTDSYASDDSGRSWNETPYVIRFPDDGYISRTWPIYSHLGRMFGTGNRGLHRSDDGGTTWQVANNGLMYPDNIPYDLAKIAMNEPPLIRAVMFRDWPEVEKLVAAGHNIDMPGNYLSGVIEADILALDSAYPKVKVSYFSNLRKLGAKRLPGSINSRLLGTTSPFTLAYLLGLDDVTAGLVEMGYDWGRPQSKNSRTSDFYFVMSEEARKTNSDKNPITGRPLAHWIDRYVAAGNFPSALRTELDLMSLKEEELAISLLRRLPREKLCDLDISRTDPREFTREFLDLLSMLQRRREQTQMQHVLERNASQLTDGMRIEVLDFLLRHKNFRLAKALLTSSLPSAEARTEVSNKLREHGQHAWAKQYSLPSAATLRSAASKLPAGCIHPFNHSAASSAK